jgi:hypothetical protein
VDIQLSRFSVMNSNRVFKAAIRSSQKLLWQNFPPMDKLPDGAAVTQVRELVQSPFIRSTLMRSSDTFLAFVLREVEFVVADQSQTDKQIIAVSGRPRRPASEPGVGDTAQLPKNGRVSKEALTHDGLI